MFLVYIILFLFLFLGVLSFLEDKIDERTRSVIYWGVAIVLVFAAGFREVGFDPDSREYERYFVNWDNVTLLDAVEYSFLFLAQVLSTFTKDVHIIFIFYALFGVLLKFWSFQKYSDSLLLLALMYICYFFELHECTQIRTGVLSSCFLLAIPYIAENKRWIAFFLLVVGTIFHMSGLILFPLLVLNNKPMGWKSLLFWGSLIPVSYVAARLMTSVTLYSEIPYIGQKIDNYQETEDSGHLVLSGINLFSPRELFSVLVFYYLLFFNKVISEKCRYYPILMKINAIGMFCFATFSFLPVLGERVGWLYRTVSIVLIPYIYCTIKPKWCGIMLTLLVAFIYLNYILRGMFEVRLLL